MSREWTEAEDALIRQRYIVEDASAVAVACELGATITASMVRSRASRIGLSKVSPLPKTPGTTTSSATPRAPTWNPKKPGKPGPRAIVMADMTETACKYPVGKDPGPGLMFLQLFCGEARDGASPYCANHGRVAYPKGRGK